MDLIQTFCEIQDPETMNTFFDEIFTPAEKHDLLMRWKLMTLLKEGMTQRNIARELHISLCKITRGAKIIKNDDSVTNQFIMND